MRDLSTSFSRYDWIKEKQKEIPAEKLQELAQKIKPVIRNGMGELEYVGPCHISDQAFTWVKERTGIAVGLKPFKTITTYHTCGHPLLFKPSIAEVITQIDKEDLAAVKAFETNTISDNVYSCTTDDMSCHVANTVLYKAISVDEALECLKIVEELNK